MLKSTSKILVRYLKKFSLLAGLGLRPRNPVEDDRMFENLQGIPNIFIHGGNREPVKISIDGIELLIHTLEEAQILKELFVSKDYFFSNNSKNIFLDVGMNSGFTSLYAANNNTVEKVYSFEPVKETYQLARKNFKLNKKLAEKIRVYPFGLGGKNESQEFIFSRKYKGSVGIRGLKSWNIANAKDTSLVKVQIKEASSVFSSILLNHENDFIICKLDCEGAEYDIIPNLSEAKLISRFGLFIVEYHDEGYTILEQIFTAEGFLCLVKPLNTSLGIIYAVNQSYRKK